MSEADQLSDSLDVVRRLEREIDQLRSEVKQSRNRYQELASACRSVIAILDATAKELAE